MSAGLLVGPLLRYTGSTQATVWVETDRACVVSVLDHRASTFAVEGHHYALVVVEGLAPDSVTPYEVRLDEEVVWPPDDGRPPSAIHTRDHERRARLVFGSCRVGAPEAPPYTLSRDEDPRGFEIDALWAFSRRLQAGREGWPDCLLLLGDQVYADEVSPDALAFLRSRRDVSKPPGEEVADFEEYTRLYRETWSDPDVRWLLSTVPSAMIFDDHDVHDDWNISESWKEDMRRLPWWEERIVGAYMSYYLYQHLGNLAPPELEAEVLLTELAAAGDGGPRLRRFARAADRTTDASRFAFHRDFGRIRLVVVDSRGARVVADGRRDMVDGNEWEWIAKRVRGDFDHVIIASTLPVFMLQAVHHLEAWNEAVCSGRWGRRAVGPGERIRRALDLDHWAAFQRSFRELVGLLRERADPSAGPAPATITILGGDVHMAYVAEVDVAGPGGSRVFQLVCSPFRNPLGARERRLMRLLSRRPAAWLARGLARAAGVAAPTVDWRLLGPPTFDNSIAILDLDGRRASITISRSGAAEEKDPALRPIHRYELA